MSDIVKFKRSELYEMVWKEPIAHIAKTYSLHAKYIARACDNYNIPRPSENYWSSKGRINESIPVLLGDEDSVITLYKVKRRYKPNDSIFKKKATTSCILRILELKTDSNKDLSTNEIIELVRKAYNLVVDRRAVYEAIEILQNLGYNIVSKNYRYKHLLTNNSPLPDRGFDADEVHFILDSIDLNPLLPEDEAKSLYFKVKRLMPWHNCATLHNIVSPVDKKDFPVILYDNIKEINTAIFSNKKISFDYMKYESNGKPIKMYETTFVISPVRYRTYEFTTYLICADDDKKLYEFRVDRMYNLEILEDTRTDVHNLYSIPINMSGTEFQRKKYKFSMICDASFATEVIDYFGHKAKLSDNTNGTFTVIHTANQNKILTFACNNPDKCEVIEPQEIRDMVINRIKNNKYGV